MIEREVRPLCTRMKSILNLFFFGLIAVSAFAQPCVSVESILVDACTLGTGCNDASFPTCNCEGKNEMFRFRVGPNNLFLSDMSIDWPSNNFLGLCQNAQTAQNVADLNDGIEACGWLQEPENGILPAGANVIVVTSADMCIESNSFANLTDTLYMLFQCPGNHMGHFANFGTGFRTLTVSFGGGCVSTVTYDRSLLVTQIGLPGAEDGAAVDFDTDGNPTYYNNGCNAPVPQEILSAGNNVSGCAGEPFEINGVADGQFTSLQWSGGGGTFSSPQSAQTLYTPAAGESGPVTLTLTATNCNGELSDSMVLTLLPEPNATITSNAGTILCDGSTATLSLEAPNVGLWSTGQTAASIEIDMPGVYSVSVENMCGTDESSLVIFGAAAPDVTLVGTSPYTICEGVPVEIFAESNTPLLWPDGSDGDSFITDEPGEYLVVSENDCGEASVAFVVEDGGENPQVEIVNLGESALCPTELTTLQAIGTGEFSWSNGSTQESIEVGAGTYTLTISNACGTASDEIMIEAIPGAPAVISQGFVTGLCDGNFIILEGSGDGTLFWDDGTDGNSLLVDSLGTYTLTAVNDCGTFTATIDVVESEIMAEFAPSTRQRALPIDITFNNMSSGAVTYQWFINGNPVSSLVHYTRHFNYPGEYEVTLIATDPYGCSDTYSMVIEIVLSEDQLFVPNAFTPDNDGLNEVFRAYGPMVEDFRMEIYNRWGELVFVSEDMNRGWNGDSKASGYYGQNDVYLWQITYTTFEGRERMTGHVVLIR